MTLLQLTRDAQAARRAPARRSTLSGKGAALAVQDWFASKGWTPFAFQREVWQAYLAGECGLVHAATGTGKTLAAWWGPLLEWIGEHGLPQHPAPNERRKSPALRVLWLTPLRALAADTREALAQPLDDLGIPWSLELRTSDSSAPSIEPPFAFAHHPVPSDAGYVLAGHLHPSVCLIGAARQSERLPCFWFGARVGVLPAFGDFTGCADVPAVEGDQVWVIAGAEVSQVAGARDRVSA